MRKETLKLLSGTNLKNTPLVDAVICILESNHSPHSIEDITLKLKEDSLNPNKTTLYRQMDKLKAAGLIQETIFSDSIRRYCIKKDHHHHHFRCIECGLTEEIPSSVCHQITDSLNKDYSSKNFLVTNHTFELEGKCSACNSM